MKRRAGLARPSSRHNSSGPTAPTRRRRRQFRRILERKNIIVKAGGGPVGSLLRAHATSALRAGSILLETFEAPVRYFLT